MQNDPESDFEDAAEFFRRGDDGDYGEAESLPAGSIAFTENDEQTDPKLLERQLERRARYTRWVKLGMSALSLVAVAALFTHALQPSAGDPPNTDERHAVISDASPPRYATLAPAEGLETPSFGALRAAPPTPDLRAQMPSAPFPSSSAPTRGGAIIEPALQEPSAVASAPATATLAARTIARSQPSTVTVAAAPRAAKVATAGARGTGRQALASNRVANPLSRSSLPSLATVQAPTTQGASRPPTARFAD